VTSELLVLHGYRRVTIDDVANSAGVGKGTIYLHWKTRESLFWSVLQRETMWLLESLIAKLSKDPRLAIPHLLIRTIFVEVAERPLVKALLLSDPEVLGNLAHDDAVRAAQHELADNNGYLALLHEYDLLPPSMDTEMAGRIVGNVMNGFFNAQSHSDQVGFTLEEQADLLALVLQRSLAVEDDPPPERLAALSAAVVEFFTHMAQVRQEHLQRAY
jgi:AcrR family transcriptional regulator